MKDIVDQVSPSFCAAKWTQVTIDLQHGMTHSCHHPIRHKIPLRELKKNASALHNTKFKMKQRKLMLKGQRPKECSYCWNIEDSADEAISDRFIKSNDDWSKPYIHDIADQQWDSFYRPKYLEVFFSSKCNLTCSYCMADVSSSIEAEMKQYGLYPLKDRVLKRHRKYSAKRLKMKDGINPYIEAFWEWLPDVYKQLHVLRLTGGEPLLDDNLDRLMDYMIEHPHSLDFIVNTNLSTTSTLVERFYDKIELLYKKCGLRTQIYTSLDTWGEQAEYIRSGMNYDRVVDNIKTFIRRFPDHPVVIMCCLNVLSIPGFTSFLKDVVALKKMGNLTLDISFLKDPGYLCAKIADEPLRESLKASYRFMEEHEFTDFEKQKLKRIILLLEGIKENDYSKERRNFSLFIKEYDRRKNKDFVEIFPSMNHYIE